MSIMFDNSSSSESFIEHALSEIKASYGHTCKIGRKSLRKYGRNPSVGTSEVDIVYFNQTVSYGSTNSITHFSSSSSADTSKAIYIEGMTISDGVLTFVTQTVTTDASDGRTKTALTTPLARATRVRGVCAGTVYVYEDTAITAGVPDDLSKVHITLIPGDNSSLNANTSIASTNYFILTKYWATLGKAAGSAAADIRFKIQTLGDEVLGNNFYTEEVFSINLSSSLNHDLKPYEIIRPNSDIVMTAVASLGTLDIKAGFHGFFADIVP